MMLRAKILILSRAPPEKRLIMPNILAPSLAKNFFKTSILIPGIGAQGGDVEQTVKAGVDTHGGNAMINASRSIIFVGSGMDYAVKAREEAEKLKNSINNFR